MTDVMTPEQRHKCMAAVKSKNTKPEIIVRKFLFSKGLRYRLHKRSLPGQPDIVLPKYKVVVFVDGCLWHGHAGCKNFRIPKSNVEFWKNKIIRNLNRDKLNVERLSLSGWRIIRIWECDIKNISKRKTTLENLYQDIINPHEPDHYNLNEESWTQVAEDLSTYDPIDK